MQQERDGIKGNDNRPNSFNRAGRIVIVGATGERDLEAEKEAREIFSMLQVQIVEEYCIRCPHYCRPTMYKCHKFHDEKMKEWLLKTETYDWHNAYHRYWEYMKSLRILMKEPECLS